MSGKKILVKLGGSVITVKDGYKEINAGALEEITSVIGNAWESVKGRLTIINGAGSFGHAPVRKHGIKHGVKSERELVGFADVYHSCSTLSLEVVGRLVEKNVPALYLAPYQFAVQDKGQLLSFDGAIFLESMERGLLPISGGNMVRDLSIGMSILSGDTIIRALSPAFDVIAFGTDVPGILDKEGKVVREIRREDWEGLAEILGEREGDVTGGMLGKVREILSMAPNTTVYIFDLRNTQQLRELLSGGEITSGEFTKISL